MDKIEKNKLVRKIKMEIYKQKMENIINPNTKIDGKIEACEYVLELIEKEF